MSGPVISRMLFPFTVVGLGLDGEPWTAHIHAYDPATAVEVALEGRNHADHKIAAVFRDHHEDIRP